MTTINPAVGASGNDGKSGIFWGGGDLNIEDATLWIGNRIDGQRDDYSIILRFVNVTIPQGATINSATITLRGEETDSTSGLAATIWGVDADNPSFPANYDAAEALTHTTATASWSNPAVTAGSNINTPSISTIVKEIVDRAGWASGQAMILVIENNGSSAGVYRSFHSYDSNASYAPVLNVDYTEASSGVSGSLSVTLGAATSSATGTVAVKGTVTKTLAAATLSSAGTIAVKGQLAKTLAGVTLSSAGKVAIKGASTSTLGAVTVASAGAIAVTGSASSTLGALSLSAAGVVSDMPVISGALSATLGAVTLSADGSITDAPIYGAVTSTLGALTGSAAGKVAVTGSANAVLSSASLTGGAGKVAISGGANITLGGVTVETVGAVTIQGSLTAALGVLTLVAAGFGGQLHTVPITLFPRDASLTLDPRDYDLTLHARGLGLTLDERDNELTLHARTNALTLEVK